MYAVICFIFQVHSQCHHDSSGKQGFVYSYTKHVIFPASTAANHAGMAFHEH